MASTATRRTFYLRTLAAAGVFAGVRRGLGPMFLHIL